MNRNIMLGIGIGVVVAAGAGARMPAVGRITKLMREFMRDVTVVVILLPHNYQLIWYVISVD